MCCVRVFRGGGDGGWNIADGEQSLRNYFSKLL